MRAVSRVRGKVVVLAVGWREVNKAVIVEIELVDQHSLRRIRDDLGWLAS